MATEREVTLQVRQATEWNVNAPIAVVVMSVGAEPQIADAVNSVVDQDVEAEIIVVNSGVGSVKDLISEHVERVTLVEAAERMMPGGARNLGIKYSHASIVAFLAADCLATPGWLSKRLESHRSGFSAVSSALRPASSAEGLITLSSWATYWMTHPRRMPETPHENTLRYGLSYDRGLFERFGMFREDVRVGEDTEFNATIAQAEGPACWRPDLITLHRYPQTLVGGLFDQFNRARRSAVYQLSQGKKTEQFYLWDNILERERRALAFVRAIIDRHDWGDAAGAKEMLPALSYARALGAHAANGSNNMSLCDFEINESKPEDALKKLLLAACR